MFNMIRQNQFVTGIRIEHLESRRIIYPNPQCF